jgi:hypothetical protein
MAVGCGPDVTGNLTAGAICADCAGQETQCDTLIDEQYGRDDPASPIGNQRQAPVNLSTAFVSIPAEQAAG